MQETAPSSARSIELFGASALSCAGSWRQAKRADAASRWPSARACRSGGWIGRPRRAPYALSRGSCHQRDAGKVKDRMDEVRRTTPAPGSGPAPCALSVRVVRRAVRDSASATAATDGKAFTRSCGRPRCVLHRSDHNTHRRTGSGQFSPVPAADHHSSIPLASGPLHKKLNGRSRARQVSTRFAPYLAPCTTGARVPTCRPNLLKRSHHELPIGYIAS